MSKVTWKPGTFLYPIPAVMVSCGTMEKSSMDRNNKYKSSYGIYICKTHKILI
jgi:hypothetical protein